LYTDPGDPSWDAIIVAAEAHPTVHVVAIVNPNNGPGSAKSSGYTTGIAALQAANIKVIGYVATGYGSHSISSMEAQIDQWKSFYPTVQGIFFDEQSTATGDVAHYQTLSQYAKSVGLSYTVGNPGTDVPAAYVGVIDTMLIYESDGVPSISSLSRWSSYAPSNFGVIPYDVSAMNTSFVQQARQYVEYIYLTNDNLPNPWDSLTSYFAQLLTALE
ncbi:MAG TPA: spherulation-specific family 4 protein, partial [Polyangia bacterium]|nr:spherulation-specific family 4 protein [Polyangia bacterium]